MFQTGKKSLCLIRDGFLLVWRYAPGWTLLLTGLGIVRGVLPAASLILTKKVVDLLSVFMNNGLEAIEYPYALILLLFATFVFVVGKMSSALFCYATEAQASIVQYSVQAEMHRKSAKVDYSCFEDPEFFNLMQMASRGALSRPVSIVRNMNSLVESVITLFSVAAVVYMVHPYLIPVAVLAVIPTTWRRVRNSRSLHEWNQVHMPDERYAGYLSTIMSGPHYAKEVRLFGFADAILSKWMSLKEKLRTSWLDHSRRIMYSSLMGDLLSICVALAGVLVVLWLGRGTHSLTLGSIALLYRAFNQTRHSFDSVARGGANLYEDSMFLEQYDRFIKLPVKIQSADSAVDFPEHIKNGISFSNVCFAYPNSNKPVLRKVSFHIAAGEHVVITGKNGAGKSTIVKLLCRLYDPDAGEVNVDGLDFRKVELSGLRCSIAVLFQDYARYYMSAEDNIRMGNLGITSCDAVFQNAASASGAADVMHDLPLKEKTFLGKAFPGGIELSTGQWQRMAVARALVKDAQIIILDEHTSSLDAGAERHILERLFKEYRDKTIIVISHRLSTVKNVDRILFLDEGTVAEQGTHDELLDRNGGYARLFAAVNTTGAV